jgi:hypothetical protein
MLQLRRPLYRSPSVALGHLTGSPVLAQHAEEASVHPMQAALSTVCLPEAVPVTPPLCPPTDPHPVIGRLPCANRLVYPTCESIQHLRQVPERISSIPQEEHLYKRT